MVALVSATLIGVALLAFTVGGNTTDRVEAATGGPEMALTIESTGSCDDPIAPTVCNILPGDTFLAKIAAVTIPASGYIVMQAALDFGNYDATASEDGAGPNTYSDTIDNGPDGDADRDDPDCVTVALTYIPAASAADEVVWPDGHPDTAITIVFGPGLVASGALSGQGGGLPTSFHVGPLVEWTFLCSPTPTTTVVSLLPFGGPIAGNDGSAFAAAGGGGVVAAKGNSVTINCIDPPPHPIDTDGDGCSDEREAGSDPQFGGQRSYLYPWDFYDVTGDGKIDLLFDILGVFLHYSPTGMPPYDANYDRGPIIPGAGPFTHGPPDGVIDLLNDILGVVLQHTGGGTSAGCT